MKPNNMKPCPVCGYMTLKADEIYDICAICMWEDDPIQNEDPDYSGGANDLSLNDYKTKWISEHKRVSADDKNEHNSICD
ncbi:MAG: hypothetical protein LBG97_08715 [Coriobacteriales bacterium]|jgi:hypothetical protein|nr:hypothetical protein [Coriobacteriales bacterium]